MKREKHGYYLRFWVDKWRRGANWFIIPSLEFEPWGGLVILSGIKYKSASICIQWLKIELWVSLVHSSAPPNDPTTADTQNSKNQHFG
jgi:hypothetical protein